MFLTTSSRCCTRSICPSVSLLAVFALSAEAQVDDRALASLDLIKEKSSTIFGDAASITFTMTLPALPIDNDQGKVTRLGSVTMNGGTCALKFLNQYEHPPVYKPPGTKSYHPMDHDAHKNLIVWREQNQYIFSGGGINDVYTALELTRLSPDNEVLQREDSYRLLRYSINDRSSLYEFDRLCLATGRGYAQKLDRILEAQITPTQQIRLRAMGAYPSTRMQGLWEIVFAGKNEDFLVREATMMGSPTAAPFVTVSCRGILKVGDLAVSREAVVWYRPVVDDVPYEVKISIESFSKAFDESLSQEIQTKVSTPLPAGRSRVIDYRQGGEPVVTRPGR